MWPNLICFFPQRRAFLASSIEPSTTPRNKVTEAANVMTSLCCPLCCEEFTAEDEETSTPTEAPASSQQEKPPACGAVDRHVPIVGLCGHTLCCTCVQKLWMVLVEQTQKTSLKKIRCPFCAQKSFRVDSKRNFFVMELVREEAERNALLAAPSANHPVDIGPRERSLELANTRLRRRLEWLNRERATWQLQQPGRMDSKPAARNNDSDEDEGGRRLTRSQVRSNEDRVDAKPQYREKNPHTASVDKPQSRKKNPPTASVSVDAIKPQSRKKNPPIAGGNPQVRVAKPPRLKANPTVAAKERTAFSRGGSDEDSVAMEVPRSRIRGAAAAPYAKNDDDSMKEYPAACDDDDNKSNSSSLDGDDSDYIIEDNNEDDSEDDSFIEELERPSRMAAATNPPAAVKAAAAEAPRASQPPPRRFRRPIDPSVIEGLFLPVIHRVFPPVAAARASKDDQDSGVEQFDPHGQSSNGNDTRAAGAAVAPMKDSGDDCDDDDDDYTDVEVWIDDKQHESEDTEATNDSDDDDEIVLLVKQRPSSKGVADDWTKQESEGSSDDSKPSARKNDDAGGGAASVESRDDDGSDGEPPSLADQASVSAFDDCKASSNRNIGASATDAICLLDTDEDDDDDDCDRERSSFSAAPRSRMMGSQQPSSDRAVMTEIDSPRSPFHSSTSRSPPASFGTMVRRGRPPVFNGAHRPRKMTRYNDPSKHYL